MTKGTRSRNAATTIQSARRRSLEAQNDSPALPRSSRFRAHDHEGDDVRGSLGTSARYGASAGDPSDDRKTMA
jgi:hypothetical protein